MLGISLVHRLGTQYLSTKHLLCMYPATHVEPLQLYGSCLCTRVCGQITFSLLSLSAVTVGDIAIMEFIGLTSSAWEPQSACTGHIFWCSVFSKPPLASRRVLQDLDKKPFHLALDDSNPACILCDTDPRQNRSLVGRQVVNPVFL